MRASLRRTQLEGERTQLLIAQHAAFVADALGDGAGVPDDPERASRLGQIVVTLSAPDLKRLRCATPSTDSPRRVTRPRQRWCDVSSS